MVVAAACVQLAEVGLYVAAYGFGRAEIHRCAGDIVRVAKRYKRLIDRRVSVGINLQSMVQYRAALVAVEVPIGMVGHIDYRCAVGFGAVVDAQAVVAAERVGNLYAHIARETVVSVRAQERELQPAFRSLNHIVNSILPPHRATVQAVGTVVLRQTVFDAVDRDASAGQSVGVAAYYSAEVGTVVLGIVVLNIVESLHDIAPLPLLVGQA